MSKKFGSSPPMMTGMDPVSMGMGNYGIASNNKKFDLFKNYQDFELPDNKLEGMKEDFERWVENTDMCEPYEHLELVRPDRIIVRLYAFERALSDTIKISVAGAVPIGMKIVPFVKVLKVHPSNSNVRVGDVLYAPPSVADLRTSMAWLEWDFRMKNERPEPNIPEPPKMAGLLGEWAADIVRLDPFNPIPEDNYTFCRSDMEFKVVYKRA